MAGIADLAQTVQDKGRGKDRHLLHVTTKELQGLQQLAAMQGGTLTRNPKTGLYEAGFLEQLLPIAITAVASYFGGPIGGAVAGGITGAISNKENPMMGAALGAVSGYGMGGLGNSLAQAGMTAAEAGAAEAGMAAFDPGFTGTAIPDAAGIGAGTEFSTPSMAAASRQSDIIANAGQSPFVNAYNVAGEAVSGTYLTPEEAYGLARTAPSGTGTMMPPARPEPSKWENIMRGIKTIPDRPAKESFQKYGMDAAMALSPLLYGTADKSAGDPNNPSGIPTTGMISPYTYNPGTRNPMFGELGQPYFLGQGYTAGTPYRAAQGGLMGLARGGGTGQPRMIRGPGTGLSDDVPAVIQGGQKAALADGEFVVSSDVVSALGEGSTDAGARKLYAMMDRVRKKAHGSKKQIRKVNEKHVLPA